MDSGADKFLALTSNEAFWDRSRKIVFLGEHCKLYERKKSLEGLDFETMDNPWDDAEKVTDAARKCLEVQEKILDRLTERLNKLHELDKDKKYYRTLLGHWLAHFLNNIYDKYERTRKAFERHGDGIETLVLDESQWVVPCDYNEYSRRLCEDKDDRHDLQLCSQILWALGKRRARKRLENPQGQSLSFESEHSAAGVFAARLSGFLSKIFHGKNTVTVTGCPAGVWNLAKLVLRSGFMCALDDMKHRIGVRISGQDRAFREKELEVDGEEFDKVAAKLVPLNLPWLFVEGFKEFRRKVLSPPARDSGAYFSVTAINSNNIYRMLAAERGPGVKMLIMQHGGGYGVDLLNLHEAHETAVADVFYTGGWVKEEKTRPLSLAKLVRNKGKIARRTDGGDGVLAGISSSGRWIYRLDNAPWAENYLKTCVDDTAEFLESLFDASKATVRIYPPDKSGLSTGERLKERVKGCVIDDLSGSFYERLDKSRIFLSVGMSTTFLETMAADRPTTALFDRKLFAAHPDAEKEFEKLEKAGILHYSPKAAAEHINRIYNEVGAWWNSPEVKKAKEDFVAKYARCVDDWAGEWIEEFKRQLKQE